MGVVGIEGEAALQMEQSQVVLPAIAPSHKLSQSCAQNRSRRVSSWHIADIEAVLTLDQPCMVFSRFPKFDHIVPRENDRDNCGS